MTDAAIDPVQLRSALGSFVTGVTVVTARDRRGEYIGLTVNSFSSVSLAPPLVLWSLAKTAASFEGFEHCAHYCVNVLAADQMHLAQCFARSGGDKFNGVALRPGIGGVPLLEGASASFTCRNTIRYPGGDHLIFVGEVVALEQTRRPPLLYARGRYAQLGDELTPAQDLDFLNSAQLRECGA